jgi:hypothetical protein
MQRRKLLVAVAHRERLRRLDKAARTLGVFFNIHGYSLSLPPRPERDQQKWKPVLRPIALQILRAHDLFRQTAHTLADHARSTKAASSMGSQAALTFLNRPAVASPTVTPA